MKDPTSLEDYSGVQIVQSDDGKKAWLGQPTIIKSLEKQFGEKVAKKKMTITPGTPGFIGGKVDDISKVDEKTQSMYRSGVGTLLYLTKHSRPDITHPLRELSKSMDGASMAVICLHVFHRAMLHRESLILYVFSYVEVVNVHVLHSFGA